MLVEQVTHRIFINHMLSVKSGRINTKGGLMRFYASHTQFYCGVDLHARNLYICVIDKEKKVLVHQNIANRDTGLFLKLLEPYKHSIVVACESTYAWYWLADLCNDNGLEFILGHAFYMKAIHGAKVKNDRIDSRKIAMLLESGMFPMSYVYPKEKRSIRDLLRRRLYFAQERADMFCHIQLMNTQANNPGLGRITKSNYKKKTISAVFNDTHMQKSIDSDLKFISEYDEVIRELEVYILEHTRQYLRQELNILQSVHGIGDIIALTILYEIDTIERFPAAGEFISYCRLIRCTHESAGKKYLGSNKKIGNPYLKRAFSEAAVFVVKFNPSIEKYFNRLAARKGKARAYGIISRKLAQAVYYMLKNKTVFNEQLFLAH
jgi:transposase